MGKRLSFAAILTILKENDINNECFLQSVYKIIETAKFDKTALSKCISNEKNPPYYIKENNEKIIEILLKEYIPESDILRKKIMEELFGLSEENEILLISKERNDFEKFMIDIFQLAYSSKKIRKRPSSDNKDVRKNIKDFTVYDNDMLNEDNNLEEVEHKYNGIEEIQEINQEYFKLHNNFVNEEKGDCEFERKNEYFDRETNKIHNIPRSTNYDLDIKFIGREHEQIVIHNYLMNFVRIINVIGVGGIGKTALVKNSLLRFMKSDNNNQFDYYIWCSAKLNYLTQTGQKYVNSHLKNIEDIYNNVLEVYFGKSEFSKLKDIDVTKKELKVKSIFLKNKIVLIMDNAETIEDNNEIMKFLEFISDECEHSKIIITSRRLLGIGDKRVPVVGLLDIDAKELFVKVLEYFNLKHINISEREIYDYNEKVERSPLAIIWCISLLQEHPTKSLNEVFCTAKNEKSDLVKFCFEEIVKNLNENQHKVLFALIGKDIYDLENYKTKHQIAYLTNLDLDVVDEIITYLCNISLVDNKVDKESPVFSVHDLAKKYILHNTKLTDEARKSILEREEEWKACINDYKDIIDNEYFDETYTFDNSLKEVDKIYCLEAIKIFNQYYRPIRNLNQDDDTKRNEILNNIKINFENILNKSYHIEIRIILSRLQSSCNSDYNIIVQCAEEYNDARVWRIYGDIERFRCKWNATSIDHEFILANPIRSAIEKYEKSLEFERNHRTLHSLGICYLYKENEKSINIKKSIECFMEAERLVNDSIEISFKNRKRSLAMISSGLADAYQRKAEQEEKEFKEKYLLEARKYIDRCMSYEKESGGLGYKGESCKLKVDILCNLARLYDSFDVKEKCNECCYSILEVDQTYSPKRNTRYLKQLIYVFLKLAENLKETKHLENSIREYCKLISTSKEDSFEKIKKRIDDVKFEMNYKDRLEKGIIVVLNGDNGFIDTLNKKRCFFHINSFVDKIENDKIMKIYDENRVLQFACLNNYKKELDVAQNIILTSDVLEENQINKISKEIDEQRLKEDNNNSGFEKIGTINFYNVERGFGFIGFGESRSEEAYFHANQMKEFFKNTMGICGEESRELINQKIIELENNNAKFTIEVEQSKIKKTKGNIKENTYTVMNIKDVRVDK